MAQSMWQNGTRPQKAQRVNKNRPLDEAGSEGVQVRLPWEQLSPAPMEQKLDVYFRSEVRVLFCLQDARAEGPLETAVQSPSGHDKFPLILEVRLAPGGGPVFIWLEGAPTHTPTLPLAFLWVFSAIPNHFSSCLFGSSIFLSTSVPCFCCRFLPFSVTVWAAAQG